MAKPTIRFKGYTDDWEQRKLGDSCKLNGRIGFRGYTEKDIISKEAGGVLTFSPTNIVDNKLTIECKNTYITREKYDESPEIKISNGDILFVKTGSTLGKSALVAGLKEDASINPQIVVMRVEKDTENFMSNVLITDRVMKQVAAVKIGGAVPTMTETELKNFTYFAPAEKEEKKKIGDHFRTLDNLITLHQRITPYFLKINAFVWEQRKLPEFVSFFNGLTYTPDDVEETGTLVLRSSNVKNGEIVDADNVYVNDKAVTSENVHEGDIIVVVRNGSRALIGKHAQIKASMPNTVIGAFMSGMRSEHSSFVNALLDTSAFENEIAKNMGATINQITGYMFSKMEFMIPSGDEQQKIGEHFQSLDNLITLHQRKCEETKILKKYMLQKMFPQNGQKVPEIRFKGFTDDWEQRKLGDVLERRIEQRQQSEEYPRLAFASGQGVIPLSERKTNNREQLTKDEYTKKYLVTELNDIVYNPANVKYGAIDRNKCGRGLISPIYVTFTTNEIPGFIERIVTSHDFQQRALRFEEGTVTKRQSVNPEDLVTLDILVAPKREEQQKIATYFDSLDHLITLHQRKCEELQNIKKFMLQNMFV